MLKNVKKGDLFRLKDTENAPVWVKGEYVRSEKKQQTISLKNSANDRVLKSK